MTYLDAAKRIMQAVEKAHEIPVRCRTKEQQDGIESLELAHSVLLLCPWYEEKIKQLRDLRTELWRISQEFDGPEQRNKLIRLVNQIDSSNSRMMETSNEILRDSGTLRSG